MTAQDFLCKALWIVFAKSLTSGFCDLCIASRATSRLDNMASAGLHHEFLLCGRNGRLALFAGGLNRTTVTAGAEAPPATTRTKQSISVCRFIFISV
ncbi:MAG: hypothetical protein DMG15_03810 [Acidobacteria bacterium]|nr:MAG: hypothetical protein DMG16_22700 [Acidobacteriota bacterium]PYS15959.1 MAG: hypothetical protein DMG15_03810 [Acidobacteriota bacterium]